MAHISLDELLALGAGGSAGMVSLNGRFLGVVGRDNLVEVDADAEAFVASFRPAAATDTPEEQPAEQPAKPSRRGRPPKLQAPGGSDSEA